MYTLTYIKKTSVSPESPDNPIVPDVSGFVNNAVYYISDCPEEIYNGAYTLTDLLTSENELIFTNGTCYLYHYDMGNNDFIGLQSTDMTSDASPMSVYHTALGDLPTAWWNNLDEKINSMQMDFYPNVESVNGKFIVSGFTDNTGVNGEYTKTDRKTYGGYSIYSNGTYDIRYTTWTTDWFYIVPSTTPDGFEYDNYLAEPDYSAINTGYDTTKSFIYNVPWKLADTGERCDTVQFVKA